MKNAIALFFKKYLQENSTFQHRCSDGLIDKKQCFQLRIWSSSLSRIIFSYNKTQVKIFLNMKENVGGESYLGVSEIWM